MFSAVGSIRRREVSAAAWIAATIRSSSSSLPMHATAPAAKSSWISRRETDAVRQTTRVLGDASSTASVVCAPLRPGIR